MFHGMNSLVLSVLAIAALILGVPSPAIALDAADLPSAIENAATPADHEAIAAYYDGQAKAAREAVARHRAMAKAYAKEPKPAAVSGRKGSRWAAYRKMAPHCEDLIKDYEKAAHQYDEMAAAHRKEATESQ